MAGTIGLTPAGQALDRYILTLDDHKLRHCIITFTEAVNRNTRDIHSSVKYKDIVLMLLRNHYKTMVDTKFKSLEDYPRILLLKYVHALTCPNFKPSTKTQEAIIRKQNKKEIL